MVDRPGNERLLGRSRWDLLGLGPHVLDPTLLALLKGVGVDFEVDVGPLNEEIGSKTSLVSTTPPELLLAPKKKRRVGGTHVAQASLHSSPSPLRLPTSTNPNVPIVPLALIPGPRSDVLGRILPVAEPKERKALDQEQLLVRTPRLFKDRVRMLLLSPPRNQQVQATESAKLSHQSGGKGKSGEGRGKGTYDHSIIMPRLMLPALSPLAEA